jgi:hypothetical protein
MIDIEELSDEQLKKIQQVFRSLPKSGKGNSSLSQTIGEEIAGREQQQG